MAIHAVSSEKVSSFDLHRAAVGDSVSVRIDPADATTQIAFLTVDSMPSGIKFLSHYEIYFSATEFATITMKQSLTLYVKRRVIEMFPNEYTKDDPRVHSYVSRLSYEGIKHVASNLEEFAKQFHSGRITMKIPKNKFNDKKR